MSEAGESTTERQTPTAERQTPTAEQQTPTAQQTPTSPQQRLQLQTPSSPSMPRSNISEGGGEQISFRPGMPSYPRSAMGDARNSMGDFAPRERRLSGLSGMSTPEHRYARRTPFQMEYSSRRSLNGSAGAASSFGPLFTPPGMRPGSVASNGSRESYQPENRDLPLPDDPDELKQKIKDNWQAQDHLRMELGCKREEILQLRQKVMDLKQELAAVNTSKGVLNEACVTGMMDVFALNSHISKLQAEKEALEHSSEQMRREAVDHDQERRGLLNVLEEKKASLQQKEEYLELESTRRKEAEQSKSVTMERLGLDLKWVQRELNEKTIRLKKLAKTNEKLARKLLALEADNTETKGIAKLLQKHNQQLDGENQELTGCIMQLEQQIDQLAKEKEEVDRSMEDMRQEHSQRLEGERINLVSKIEKLEKDLKTVKEKHTDDDITALKAQNEQISWLEDEKAKMVDQVKSLSVGIELLKEEQKLQEEAAEQMRKEYVRKLEEDTQALRARVQELERHLDDARASETESSTAYKHAHAQIHQLEEEKLALDAQVKSFETQISDLQGRLDTQSDADKRIKAREVRDMIEEKEELEAKVESVEKAMKDVVAQKQVSDELVRKLKQDIRDCEQQKSTLAHQVNVLEWHLSGLYAEKQEALRTLEDRNLEVIRLQQDLADKDEDLDRVRQENVDASEAVSVRSRELRVSTDTQDTDSIEVRQRNARLEEENFSLRDEVRKLRGKLDESMKLQTVEKKSRRKSFMNLSLEFKF